MRGKEVSSEHEIDVVAEAIFNQRVSAARAQIGKIKFDCSALPLVFSRLEKESQTGQVLIFSTFLEERIEDLFKSHLLHLDSKKTEDAVFGSNGPLGTFGNRITLAYQLGWLSKETKLRLDAFRKIRNEFAHNAFRISFSDKKIISLFATIDYKFRDFMIQIKKMELNSTGKDDMIPLEEFTPDKIFLGQLTMLAFNTFREFLVRPTAIAYQVPEQAILGEYGSLPENIKNILRGQAKIILTLFRKPIPEKQVDPSDGMQ